MVYTIIKCVSRVFFKLYLRAKVTGKNNIPSKGAFILAANHASYLDPFLLTASVKRAMYFMARAELLSSPGVGWILRKAHAFPVKRYGGDLNAIKVALRTLAKGIPVGIFPEGTRTKNRQLKRAKPGVGFLVYRSKAPVIPAYIEGTFDAMPRRFSTLKRHPVKLYIGKPIDLSKECAKPQSALVYQEISDTIMRHIAELKPGGG